MPFEVLSCDAGESRWRELVCNLPSGMRDLHFLPEYGRIYQKTYGYRAILAVYWEASNYILQPIVCRSLSDLPFLRSYGDRAAFCDISNPYGFGGPLCRTDDLIGGLDLYRKFADAMADWCDKQRIASEFTALHPFFLDHQLALLRETFTPRLEKTVVYMNLDDDPDALMRQLRKGHKSSISAARRAHVKVQRVAADPSNLSLFYSMYIETMRRRDAAERWLFPEDYFANCVNELGDRRASLFFATIGDQVESCCLLLHDFQTAYYHFAATRDQHRGLGVNNLLVWECACWLREAGYRRFHLGGGVSRDANDSLLRFKAGFSKQQAPLFVYSCVRDKHAYETLCERRRVYELEATGREFETGYFPLYRG